MADFIFHDTLTIRFGGDCVFEVSDDLEFVTKKMPQVNAKLGKSLEQHRGNLDAQLNDYLDAIDEMLGNGATGKIFAGHSLTARNVIGAYVFIMQEILSQYNEFEAGLDELNEKLALASAAEKEKAKATVLGDLQKRGIEPVSTVTSAAKNALRPRL